MPNNIETEIRSFLSKEQYDRLLDFFKQNAKLLKEDNQETFYFDCAQDLRIQKNDFFAKIWMKGGQIHDAHREEIELRFDRADFEKAEQLFLALGYQVKIKWFRKRFEFDWNGTTVCLDFTRGYGYIIELEKMCSEADKEKEYAALEQKLRSLNVDVTPREEFDRKFLDYKANWRQLTKTPAI
ncbi:hypothetical protein A2482_00275 [Candidatus Falkowbacteria bacterium RIFOXYC2_FULL_48_21]|uniref:CYTH domain-containing protein n=1 Tax=Candidatus Falkowbacteria bacterium RIFOXYC2_FULL_48_21 TaxID=1798005 RepID=A0A1F5TCE6_9BACT|nr:MAG: hypothetical protein A2482_00275 [Candidatus Falkowbacteria bacterium RIFOXYC2_FULL_48_21]